ncbi:MAG: formimidoylglutamate deiminase [Myxococcota bacterium]
MTRLPGIGSAHSHAFQRALRGRTQTAAGDSFWSWRDLMYRFAERIDPEAIYDLSRLAYLELARHGVTAVGEFHYVHHQPGGVPYDDRLELADAVIRAARDVGLRVTLLRVLYHRGGAGVPAAGAQLRFSDPTIELALGDVEALSARYRGDPAVRIGVAPHSVRAVPRSWLGAAAAYAETHALPLHMHVAEQRRELAECMEEYGVSPVRLLAEEAVLGPRFVAVHATHLDEEEQSALGRSQAFACICRTTERDLGDGAPNLQGLHAAGVRLCTGVDSHALSDPFEEARAMELDERTRTERRHAALDGPELRAALHDHGYEALGFSPAELAGDRVELDDHDLSLAGTDGDGRYFGVSGRAVRASSVAGAPVIEDGQHRDSPAIRGAFERALARILE